MYVVKSFTGISCDQLHYKPSYIDVVPACLTPPDSYVWISGLPAAVVPASPSKQASPARSPNSAWALRALKQGSAQQAAMLQSLLDRHLQGQLLLAGNPVLVPVLGHNVLFRQAAHERLAEQTWHALHHFASYMPWSQAAATLTAVRGKSCRDRGV